MLEESSSTTPPLLLLQLRNAHPRDAGISFFAPTHVYTVLGRKDYTSVTTWNHAHFEAFDETRVIANILNNKRWAADPEYKYYRRSAEDIREEWETNRCNASTAGTHMHEDIERFYNGLHAEIKFPDSLEFGTYFRRFEADFSAQFPHMRPFRTEWCVYFEEIRIAGSIDMVFESQIDGALWIYDWKRCKEIVYEPPSFGRRPPKTASTPCINHVPDCNFWHYSLQLNVYKFILERKYGKKVEKLCLVCMHPDNASGSYDLHEVGDMSNEVQALHDARLEQLALLDAVTTDTTTTTTTELHHH